MAGPGRSGPPAGQVTAARLRTLRLLLERDGRWVPSPELARVAGVQPGATYESLRKLTALGWVELRVDEGTERRAGVGARGRKPRHVYRLTALGKTVIIEAELENLT